MAWLVFSVFSIVFFFGQKYTYNNTICRKKETKKQTFFIVLLLSTYKKMRNLFLFEKK
jgi:hypothetical protein